MIISIFHTEKPHEKTVWLLFVTFLLCGKPVAYRKLTHLSVSPRKMSFSDTPIILLCI